LGVYSSARTASMTRNRVRSTTLSGVFRQRDTVAVDTPALRATSSNVGEALRVDLTVFTM